MANGNIYDVRKYDWQVRTNEDGSCFIRYDDHDINQDNKGRYNTSPLISAEINGDIVSCTTRSGSRYCFRTDKCVRSIHLVLLAAKFGVAF